MKYKIILKFINTKINDKKNNNKSKLIFNKKIKKN